MSDDKVELDKDTLKKLFEAAGMDVPENLDSNQVNNAITKIKQEKNRPIGRFFLNSI